MILRSSSSSQVHVFNRAVAGAAAPVLIRVIIVLLDNRLTINEGGFL
jgi:hypothetical protein